MKPKLLMTIAACYWAAMGFLLQAVRLFVNTQL
jgi:hypothetical protein